MFDPAPAADVHRTSASHAVDTTADDSTADDTQLPGPGRTGSAQAVAVLLLLARHTSGLTVPDIAASTNLTREDVAAALYGLRQRHRVRCVWIEQAARWFLIQHTPRSAPAHPSLDG